MKNAEFALKQVMNILAEHIDTCERMGTNFPNSSSSWNNRYSELVKVWNEIIENKDKIKFGEPF